MNKLLFYRSFLIRARSVLFNSYRSVVSKATNQLVNIIEDEKHKSAEICLQRPPVNSLNLQLIQEISSAIKYLEEKEFRSFVLSSACPKVFSAGLDLMEICNPTEQKFRIFWKAFQDMWKTLYLTPLHSVAAISGHAPAAGCVLALSCDYRIMIKSKATIGISGIYLGIVVPKWFRSVLISNMGLRNAEKSLCLGSMYSAEEASLLNLVDEVADGVDDLQAKAKKNLMSKVPAFAQQTQKISMRRKFIDELEQYEEEELVRMLQFFQKEETCQSLKKHIDNLKAQKG